MQLILSSLQALDMEISYGLRVNAGKTKVMSSARRNWRIPMHCLSYRSRQQ